ncbi:MAG: hypothetical protein C0627_04560 [Sulfurimonas sp.]|nr:MAG: hypothetical protein C0627_04560 [Sulfurimonas sp.]
MIKSLKDLLDKFSRFTNSLVYDGGICKRLPNLFILGGGVVRNNPFILDFLKEEYNNSSFKTIRSELKMSVSDIDNASIEGLKIVSKG